MAYSPRLLHLLTPGIIALVLLVLLPPSLAAAAAADTESSILITNTPSPGGTTPPDARSNRWVDTWASMPQLTEPQNLPPAPFNATNLVFANTTLRQTVRLTALPSDEPFVRIRISNAFGGSDLSVTSASVALPRGGAAGVSAVEEGTTLKLTFSGEANVVVPIDALVVSDPVRLGGSGSGRTTGPWRGRVAPGIVLTVTIYSKEGQLSNSVTSHPGSRTTSWFARGEHVEALDLPATGAGEGEARVGVAHWYWLSAVEVWAPKHSRALVIIGDSITDGRGSTDNGNNRWPDLLFNRLQASHRTSSSLSSLSVINQAAGGNRILNDGLGPNALARIDRDVLAHSGVTHALIYIGVNDIGTSATSPETQVALTARLIWSYKQIIERLKAHELVVIGATITPFSGPGQSYTDVEREGTRKRVNEWIRREAGFDAVVDFDRVLADPVKPEQLRPEYHAGDYLHPNLAGFQALVDRFPLQVLE